MDPTPKYARVMRIASAPEEDDWEAVPREKGWTSIEKKPGKPIHWLCVYALFLYYYFLCLSHSLHY